MGALYIVVTDLTLGSSAIFAGTSEGIVSVEPPPAPPGPVRTKSLVTDVSSWPVRLSFIVAPSAPTEVTSASPRVRAKAVVALRRGVRRVLVEASLPTVPNGSAITPPMTVVKNRASVGPANHAPSRSPTAPAAMHHARELVE